MIEWWWMTPQNLILGGRNFSCLILLKIYPNPRWWGDFMPFSNSPRHQYHRAQQFHLPTIQIHYTFHHLSLLVPLEFHLQLRPLHLGHRALTKYTICLKSCLMLAGGDSGAEERARNTFTTNLQNSPFGNNHQLGALLVQAGYVVIVWVVGHGSSRMYYDNFPFVISFGKVHIHRICSVKKVWKGPWYCSTSFQET